MKKQKQSVPQGIFSLASEIHLMKIRVNKVNGRAREGALGYKVNGRAREGALGYKVNGRAREGALGYKVQGESPRGYSLVSQFT
jgi:hypothetical protein